MKRPTIILLLLISLFAPLGLRHTRADSVSDVNLVVGGTGGTTTVATSGSTTFTIGASSDTRAAQSFQVSDGFLSQITFNIQSTTSSPTGTITWGIYDDNISIPGNLLQSGTITPSVGNNTVTVSSGIFLSAGATYWLVLRSTAIQAGSWNIWVNQTNPYASGQGITGSNGGVPWLFNNNNDLVITVTTAQNVSTTINTQLAQSFAIGQTSTLSSINLYLKKTGSPTGTLTLLVEQDAGNYPDTLTIANGTATYSESSLSTSYAFVSFSFSQPVSLLGNALYWMVLTTTRADGTNGYISWGTLGSCGFYSFKMYQASLWQLSTNLSIFSLPIQATATPTATYTSSPTYTPLPTFTPTPNINSSFTLPSGQAAQVEFSTNVGEMAGFAISALILVSLIYIAFAMRIRR